MANEPQLIANRSNASSRTSVRPYLHDSQTQRSTSGQGPVTGQGISRVSRNAVTGGLFSATDFVLPDEREIYTEFCASYESDLAPVGPIEQTFAAEIIHAAWRLRRCSIIEAGMKLKDGDYQNEQTRKSVDRARAAAFRIFTRSLTEFRKLQIIRKKQPTPVFTKQSQSEPAQVVQIPRGAPCSCGSGVKYKRCCGKGAPPVLNRAA